MSQPSSLDPNNFLNINAINNGVNTSATTVTDLQNQITNLQSQIQQLNQQQSINTNIIPNITTQLTTLTNQVGNSITYDDIPVGSQLAKEFNLNFGDLDIIESIQNGFIFGSSIWGSARIGNYSYDNG